MDGKSLDDILVNVTEATGQPALRVADFLFPQTVGLPAQAYFAQPLKAGV
jgi:hypothetical protein